MDWNQRFDTPDYLFGTKPAAFLQEQAAVLTPGSRVLCIADGEGRNSVHLAQLGHDVTAFDLSHNALAKARDLADQAGVKVDFRQSDLDGWDWSQTYDAVVGVFFQFVVPNDLTDTFDNLDRAVAPGGLLLVHGYAPRQVENATGGPSNPEQLYTLPMLRAAFAQYDVLVEQDYDRILDEGTAHSGPSSLIDFVARKLA